MTREFRILAVDDMKDMRETYELVFASARMNPLALMRQKVLNTVSTAPPPPSSSCVFKLELAVTGQAAKAMVQESISSSRRFALAFVDMRMPSGWNGFETIQEIWKVDPDIEMVIVTAYSDTSLETIAKELGQIDRLLIFRKPCHPVVLRQAALSQCWKWAIREELKNRLAAVEAVLAQQSEEIDALTAGPSSSRKAAPDLLAELRRTREALRKETAAMRQAIKAVR